jgi:hypothetical protein
MRPEGLAIFRALYRPTTRGVRHRKVADDFVMRLTVLRGTNQVKVQKPSLFRKENDHPQIAPITQIPK